jgi:NADPH:quinone reductase-like Zn-dependent oxidoreductase
MFSPVFRKEKTMRAIVYRKYGPPDVLRLEEIATPVPRDNQVLVRVRAASVNPLDWHFIRGTPGPMRLITGLGKPRSPGIGRDLAGEVHAVGNRVTQFKPGNAVYGTGRGAFAEFACASPAELALKPEGISFLRAAAVPIAGLTALQALRDKAHVRPGMNVLVNGASGGVGTFAVQIGKSLGAAITAVCSARNIEFVRSIGADHVIDYAREDFTRGSQIYDAILDCVGNHPFSSSRRVLHPRGVYVGIGAGGPDVTAGDFLGSMLKERALSLFDQRKMTAIMARINTADLNALSELMNAGKVTPVIDRDYALADTADAVRHVEAGHARGKVVIVV